MELFTRKPRTEGVSDPTKLLIVDHEKVERIFEAIFDAASANTRAGLGSQLQDELQRHMRLEEEIVYPFIRAEIDGGAEMVREAKHEHGVATQLLMDLAVTDPGSDEFVDTARALEKAISHHVKEEEHTVLPKLDEHATATQLNDLRGRMEQAKFEPPVHALPAEPERRASSRRGLRAPKAKPVLVQRRDGGGWEVRRKGASRASRLFDTKAEAERFARQLAKREGADLTVA